MRKIVQKSRKSGKGIDFEKSHQLTENSYKRFDRIKFCTPVFGVKSIPTCPKDDVDVFGLSEEEKEKVDHMKHFLSGSL